MDARQVFAEGCKAYEPSPTDNPDCIPFYRAWTGLTAAWSDLFPDKFGHIMHTASCAASYHADPEKAYEAAVAQLRGMVDGYQTPREPIGSYYCGGINAQEPTESTVKAFFNSEFKRAFPGERANSKHAHELWAKNRDKATAILRERYEAALADYQKREDEQRARNAARRQEWIDGIHAAALLENAVRSL